MCVTLQLACSLQLCIWGFFLSPLSTLRTSQKQECDARMLGHHTGWDVLKLTEGSSNSTRMCTSHRGHSTTKEPLQLNGYQLWAAEEEQSLDSREDGFVKGVYWAGVGWIGGGRLCRCEGKPERDLLLKKKKERKKFLSSKISSWTRLAVPFSFLFLDLGRKCKIIPILENSREGGWFWGVGESKAVGLCIGGENQRELKGVSFPLGGLGCCCLFFPGECGRPELCSVIEQNLSVVFTGQLLRPGIDLMARETPRSHSFLSPASFPWH